MFRILIADDEGIMRESIRQTIQTGFGSECEIQTVKTGREVIEQCETFRPDIAFVDIQMPGLSGIQAIQEVRKFNTQILFIIITAYDRFSYAQEAVNLGVMEYITKPVNKKKITDVCVRAMHQVEEMRKKRSDDLKVREKLEIVIPMIEDAFINNLLLEDKGSGSAGYLEMLDIREEYCYLIVLEFGESLENGTLTNAVGSNVRMNKYYEELREIIGDYLDCVIGPLMGNRIVLYVPFDKERAGYEQRVEMITRARNLVRRLEKDFELQFRAGIGDVHRAGDAYTSYKEATRCLRSSDGHVIHAMDLSAASKVREEDPVDLEDRWLALAMKADAMGAVSLAEELYDWMEETEEISEDECAMRILELILRLQQKALETGILSRDKRHRENYLSTIQEAAGRGLLREWFLDRTRMICDEIMTSRQRESESVVGKAAAYIKEHFAEDISLDEVARLVDISPYYFSKLFKQETGENFIEFLTDTRIQKAKEYLSNPRYSIKEICVMCGYSDPNYFSRIFKKYEGVTPSEYRG